ncbi:MAG TPA: tRNA (adenosine(37)-N6)-threonylcarbamoyltransferase complex transferase subunit TsaD, partial [Opitutus sp.]|nr:tRNA (adenosine(37)-N6)-threonylcarbamoyltransferase complex transferase subunit TsaD [Opitutus sp.]
EIDFSFSGVKTSLRYLIEKMPAAEVQARRADLCASYQQAVIDALVRKTRTALRAGDTNFRSVGLSGGVANNRVLREAFQDVARRERIPFFAARPEHTGDNAGMIAFAAWADRERGEDTAGMALRIEPSAALQRG